MQSYSDLSNSFFSKNSFDTRLNSSVGKVILQADLGSDTTCDTPKSAPYRL
jgi:hypothetical protein